MPACPPRRPISAQQAPRAAPPIRALYITGGGFHDFKAQEKIIPPGIAARTNIVWTIDNSADTSTKTLIKRHETTAWADSFDVVVYNMSFSYVVDTAWIARIAHAHRDKGVAAIILHGATHSYRRGATDAWRELMGVASMRHDTQREFPRLERLAADNPIVKALPKDWGPGSDELYNIDRSWPTMTPLVQAWSIEGEKHFPVVWTNTLWQGEGVRDDDGPQQPHDVRPGLPRPRDARHSVDGRQARGRRDARCRIRSADDRSTTTARQGPSGARELTDAFDSPRNAGDCSSYRSARARLSRARAAT